MIKRSVFSIIYLLTVSALLLAQFPVGQSGFSSRDIGVKINSSRDVASLFSRLQMTHSVGAAMSSSSFGSIGVMSYQNNFFLPVSEKMSLKGTLYLMQPAFASNPMIQNNIGSDPSIYYDTELNYKLGEKTNISIGISNFPYYQSPYYQGYGFSGRAISPIWMKP
ncbi:MAG TPA: hypothetical protein ENN84_09130 [Candidatus Marinimicrobia bacterium]|nr:hypothetical protein [Candidatus Neomarinimicrobiota bacterium]